MNRYFVLIGMALLSLSPGFLQAEGETETAVPEAKPFNIAVFVPGVIAGSPIYEQLVEGTAAAAAEHAHASVKVLEAGFNQAEWE